MRPADTKVLVATRPLMLDPDAAKEAGADEAYSRYLVNCSDYIRRQMMIYQHWPQRRYDTLGYRDEKVFTDMNS